MSTKLATANLPADLMAGRVLGRRHLELLDELEAIVLTEGFRDLTVGGLAERLHCSRRTLYELADSKDDLVLLVIDRILRRVAHRAQRAVRNEATRLGGLRAFLLQGPVELHSATISFAEDLAADPAAHELVARHFRYATQVVARMLSEGIAAGEFVPINTMVAAEVINAGLAHLQDPQVLRSADVSLAEAFEEFLTIFTDGIRRPAGADVSAAVHKEEPPA